MSHSLPAIGAFVALVLSSTFASANVQRSVPSEEESAPTPIPLFAPLSFETSSELPCPSGTTPIVTSDLLACAGRTGKEGPAVVFDASARVRAQGAYANDKRTGHWWELRADGSVARETDYTAGERHGLAVTFYPDGTRQTELHFNRGKLDGVARVWSREEKLLLWRRYENGVLVETRSFR